MSKTRKEILGSILEYALIALGAAVCGAAMGTLMIPNGIVSGGVTGLAVIAYHALGVPTGVGMLILNLPILWLGWKYLCGRRLFTRSLVGILAMSIVTDVVVSTGYVPTTDRLLIIFYGGMLNSIGLALVFHARGTTGGADILGRLVNRWTDMAVGQAILVVNIVVFVLAGALLGLEAAAIALMAAFVMTSALDSVLHGLKATRAATIVTNSAHPLADVILEKLNRGVTIMSGEGAYTGAEKAVLYVVVTRAETARLKRLVEAADPGAFMTISTPNEVVGAFSYRLPTQ